jgi:hypothetical protein
MRNGVEILDPNVIDRQAIAPFVDIMERETGAIENNNVHAILNADGSDDFVSYVRWLGLQIDENSIVLPSVHHYFYDADEMKNAKSLINLKELNQIKDLKGLLSTLFLTLPQKSYFIGSFIDNKTVNGFELRKGHNDFKNRKDFEAVENGILSRIPFLNMLYSLMDAKINSYLTKSSVIALMENHGFQVLDITELNGLSFFCAQKIQAITD